MPHADTGCQLGGQKGGASLRTRLRREGAQPLSICVRTAGCMGLILVAPECRPLSSDSQTVQEFRFWSCASLACAAQAPPFPTCASPTFPHLHKLHLAPICSTCTGGKPHSPAFHVVHRGAECRSPPLQLGHEVVDAQQAGELTGRTPAG